MPAGGKGRCLIVDDEAIVCRAIARLVRREFEPVLAGSVAEASRELAKPGAWWAFVIDVLLPDGSGLDFLADARRTHPTTPAMVLTGWLDPVVVNAAHDLDATCVIKPADGDRILRFLRARPRPELVVDSWVGRYALSEAEGDVLRRAVLGSSKEAIAASRGSSRLTVKKQVSNALHKTGDSSLLAAVQRVLKEAMKGRH
ncbi:MAG TPA: response regulator [Polyangiaceae bacterium]|nr:response regulator [Polyangiaceae bacterium]